MRIPALTAIFLAASFAAQAADAPHNVILFVPDGLRADMVSPETAPAIAALRDRGVAFANPHAMFPTFTMPNSSAMASGHYLGDTGVFSNTVFAGYPVAAAGGSVTPFLESDPVEGDVDEHYAGDFVNETTILKAARTAGYATAAIGKLGPTLMFDHTARTGADTIVVDDQTGTKDGIPLSAAVKAAIEGAGLPAAAPSRGANGQVGDSNTPGTKVANVAQQGWFADVATKAVLPMLQVTGKPFVLVFWSRDPDGTEHNQGDSLNILSPGINGPTSLAAIRNVDNNLAQVRRALNALGLAETTDIVVSADHGFSTISKQSATSPSAHTTIAGVPPSYLPPGFLALDLSKTLNLPLFDPDGKNAAVAAGTFPKRANGLLGADPAKPDVVVAANGGSDLVYVPSGDKSLAGRVVEALLAQDYVSGIWVDPKLGRFAGTMPLDALRLAGSALTPVPAIVVNFRSHDTGCGEPLKCAVSVADTWLQQGQGMHGSFSRADTKNFMAATGPDFKVGFIDPAPVSNADVGRTLAALMKLEIAPKGKLMGRVIEEALPGNAVPDFAAHEMRSEAAANGLATVMEYQTVGDVPYFDAAGFPGRTVGLKANGAPQRAER